MSKRMTPEKRDEMALKKRLQKDPYFFIGTTKYKALYQLVRQGGEWMVKQITGIMAKGKRLVTKMAASQILKAIEEHATFVAAACRNTACRIPRRVHQAC
jgi:beta-galactosidase GanA